MGRRHEAHVGAPRLDATHPTEGTGLDQAQQLHLLGQRNVADLVQEQRAAVGGFHEADLRGRRAGERTLLMAEQFVLEQRLRKARAVHDDEGLAGTAARLVDRLGHHLLARAGLAQQQHGGVGRCHP